MTENAGQTSIVVERVMPHPPEKIWRALTQPELIAQWLMQNDFKPVVGHAFHFRHRPRPGWNGVNDCTVLTVEPPTRLAYTWDASAEEKPQGLKSVVTWTLTPVEGGTRVRMEHTGFRPKEDEMAFKGMSGGWPGVVAALERVSGEQGKGEGV